MNRLLLPVVLFLCGCSATSTNRESLEDKIKDGWVLHLYEDKKLVLIKQTDEELLVDDYFNTLTKE